MVRCFLVAAFALVAVGCAGGQTAESAWVQHTAMEVARSEHPAVILDGRIVVIGGLVEIGPARFGTTASVEAYDPDTDSWARLPDLPQPRHHSMAAVVDERLFSVGGFSESGFDATDGVWELVDESWVGRAPLPEPVGAGAAVVLAGRIYVVGGAPAGGLHVYDPATDLWETLPAPSTFREHLAAVAHQGEIWAIAGRESGRIHSTVEIFDPMANSWRPGPSLGEARSGFGAVSTGGVIYVAGGEVFDPNQALASTERLDIGKGEWAEFESLPIGLHGHPLVSIDGSLFLAGGSTRAAGVENAGELWSIDP